MDMRVGGVDHFVRAAGSTKRTLSSWTNHLDHLNVGCAAAGDHATDFSLAELRVYNGEHDDGVHISNWY